MATTTQQMYQDKRTASERLSALENTIPSILRAVGAQIDPLTQQMQALVEAVNELRMYTDVLVGLQDVNVVAEKVREVRLAHANEQMAEEDADTAQQVSKGFLVPTETCDEGSVLVISATDASGQPSIPDHRRVAVAQTKPDVKPLLVGRKVGETITLPDGSTVTIREAYRVDTKAVALSAQKA